MAAQEIEENGGETQTPNDIFLTDYSAEATGSPEVDYYSAENGFESVLVNLDENSKRFEGRKTNGSNIILEGEELDREINAIAGNVSEINTTAATKDQIWSAQKVLQGTRGNDQFEVSNRQRNEDNPYDIVDFIATSGNDIYIGSEETEKISYQAETSDNLTGLFISDKPENLPIITDNMPPLVTDEYTNDSLLIYKANEDQGIYDVDVTKDIDIIQLSNNDDTAVLTSTNTSLINFMGGNDQAIIKAQDVYPLINKIVNVENIIWEPLDSNGNHLVDLEGIKQQHEFEVIAAQEDLTSSIIIEDYLPTTQGTWILESFGDTESNFEEWIKLKSIPAEPERIGDGKVIVYSEIIENEDEGTGWIEIHAQDLRSNGQGLIGLDLNISWNNERLNITQASLDENNIFNNENLPLFQNKGNLEETEAGVGKITNLVAAALPRSGTGIALGNTKEPDPQTLFAKIPFTTKNTALDAKINININSYPASAGETVEEEELIIMTGEREEILVLEINGTQKEVGSHLFRLRNTEGNSTEYKNIAINIKNTNDIPTLIPEEELEANALEIQTIENSQFVKNIGNLFKDDDNDPLLYQITKGPEWITVNQEQQSISGVPPNDAQGLIQITIQAKDPSGAIIERKLTLDVKNLNQSPTAGPIIEAIEITQDQDFIYRLPVNAFVDPDLDQVATEKMTYSIKEATAGTTIPSWLNIDPNDGTLSGRADKYSVGNTSLIIRATDSEGLYAEQEIRLQVSNVNDAPTQTEELTRFLNAQILNDELEVSPNDPYAIFNGIEKEIDISRWFDDADLLVDNEEKLSFEVFLLENSGEILDASSDDVAWMNYENNNTILRIKAGDDQIGKQYIKVVASDTSGSQSIAIVDFNVRLINRAPTIEPEGIIDYLARQTEEGVVRAEYRTNENTLRIEIEEERNIKIKLPSSLFNDPDLSIDEKEKLTIRMKENLNQVFKFNQEELTITGNVEGFGVDSNDGLVMWEEVLVATDNAGETIELKLILEMQRSIEQPSLIKNLNALSLWDEGQEIALNTQFTINARDKTDQNLNLSIKHRQKDGQSIKIITNTGEEYEENLSTNDGQVEWNISGKKSEIMQILQSWRMRTGEDANIANDYEIDIEVYAQLGTEGIKSEKAVESISIRFEPIPTIPVWNKTTIDPIDDVLSLLTLGERFEAGVDDPGENITYSIEIPTERQDIVVTNKNGVEIGESQGNKWILNENEWKNAVIRSTDGNTDQFELKIDPISTESLNKRSVQGETISARWATSPLLEESGNAFVITPQEAQVAGQLISIPIELELPNQATTSNIRIRLPKGTDLTSLESGFKITSQQNGGYELFDIELKKSGDVTQDKITLEITTAETYSGKLEGTYQIYSSTRTELNMNNEINKEEDLKSKLASISNEAKFELMVYKVAKIPEISEAVETNEATKLKYNQETQQVIIPFRRGATSTGIRNENEVLMVSISGIPEGYALAKLIDGKYQKTGATDVFGTLTLFSIPKASQDNTDISNYQMIEDGELYLVSERDEPISLEGKQLTIKINAKIAGEEDYDTRSESISKVLNLQDPTVNNLQKLGRKPTFVDPIIINLSPTKEITLSSFSENDGNIKFEMLPGYGPMSTGWLSAENEEQTAGYLVMNDTANDNDGDITIASITELFSEYFQSKAKQTFYSGTAALASIDSNDDKKINKEDAEWNNILIWFDNGDAVSDKEELKPLSEFIDSIDLGSINTISEQKPTWAKDNTILRQLTASKNTTNYTMYDVGLRVSPSNESESLDLSLATPITILEQGRPGPLQIASEGSEAWSEDGRDALTLVRLSGIPDAIVPTLGTKDSRGDWLFTWAELKNNSGKVDLITNADWSGASNAQVIISQVQADGRMLVSQLQTIAIDVIAVADKPRLRLNNIKSIEDELIPLDTILKSVAAADNDGSESIHLEIHNLPDGMTIIKQNGETQEVLENEAGHIKFKPADVSQLSLKPAFYQSGNYTLEWRAVATEESNGSQATTTISSEITIEAKANAPKQLEVKSELPVLKQRSIIELQSVFENKTSSELLTDLDGSEQLRIRIQTPSALRLAHNGGLDWLPVQFRTSQDGKTNDYIIEYNDLKYLNLIDEGIDENADLIIKATTFSREISNNHQALSDKTEILIDLPYARNAKPAQVNILAANDKKEDEAKWQLAEIFTIIPGHVKDNLSIQFTDFPEALKLLNPEGVKQNTTDNLDLNAEELDQWSIQGEENTSGTFTIKFQVNSTPEGIGRTATSLIKEMNLSIDAVADQPHLVLNLPGKDLETNRSGWLDIGSIIKEIGSEDKSEELSLRIQATTEEGAAVALPDFARFNNPAKQIENHSWIVNETSIANLKLYVGTIEQPMYLSLIAQSQDGESIKTTTGQQIKIASNIVVEPPILQISSTLSGDEDQAIPIMQVAGGVISTKSRDESRNEVLELELSNLPDGMRLVRGLTDADGNITFSATINETATGQHLRTLRLNLEQWQDIYIQGPQDSSGSFSFNVQSYAISQTGLEKSSQIEPVQLKLNPVNDGPELINANDLKPILENSFGVWDLRGRFSDIDHSQAELKISVQQRLDDGSKITIPSWLSLNTEGILQGTPGNDDVAELNLLVTATDRGGMQAQAVFHLSVGNTNDPPAVQHDLQLLDTWQKIENDAKIIYSKVILLRDKLEINLLNQSTQSEIANGLFSDPDSKHESQELKFELSKDGVNWSEQIKDLAIIADDMIKIEATSKNVVGDNTLFVRALDRYGASSIQEFQLNVENVNDAPRVIRPTAVLIGANQWEESISLEEGDSTWEFKPGRLFDDADLGDLITVRAPTGMPSWINIDENGNLSGTPGNSDVGDAKLTWRGSDNSGANAYFTLKVTVENVNQAPVHNNTWKSINTNEDIYENFDLNKIFTDADTIHGDSLMFKYKLLDLDSNVIEDADWLGIEYTQTELPDSTGKLLIQTVLNSINSDGSTGSVITAAGLKQLDANTAVRVEVKVSDDRGVELKGLIGIDLDIAWSENIELVDSSTKISEELPLFNEITNNKNGMQIAAGSIPDMLSIGGVVGDQIGETAVKFDVIMKNPELANNISVTPGQGYFRDGILDRYAQRLGEDISVVHSFATQSGAELTILSPENRLVGDYLIELTATDQSGSTTTVKLQIKINNINDRPLINIKANQELKTYIEKYATRATALPEGEKITLQPIHMFTDEDLVHGNDELTITMNEESGNKIEGFDLTSDKEGNITLSISAPNGITNYINQKIQLIATDKSGESIAGDWFTAIFKPEADITNITTGSEQSILHGIEEQFSIPKNESFDIKQVLSLNAIELKDSVGDTAVLKIRIPFSEASLNVKDTDTSSIIQRLNQDESTEFTVLLKELGEVDQRNYGDLSGLTLSIPNNRINIMPLFINSDHASGIPMEIWTETNVIGDNQNQFNTATSENSIVWLTVKNKTPTFKQPDLLTIDKNEEDPQETQGRALINLYDLFEDDDLNDLKEISIEAPSELKDYLKFDSSNGQLMLQTNANTSSQIPTGLHRIGIRMRDSSGMVGDRSGFSTGSIQILVKGVNSDEGRALGLNLLAQVDTTNEENIRDILKSPEATTSESVKQLQAVLRQLNILDPVANTG